MQRGLNKVMVIGWITGVPEFRYTAQGRLVASLNLSTTQSWVASDGSRLDKTEWFNVVVWGDLAEQSHECLVDGQQLYVEGRLQTRSWEDKEGNKQYRTEVIAQDLVALGLRPESRFP